MNSRDPKAAPKILRYSKKDVARTQLEAAITLWFNYGDPMSIHTLAAAANKCYHGMGSKTGKPTIIGAWKKGLKKREYDLAVKAENFGKHANTDATGTLDLITEYAELLMLDGVMAHERLFHRRTALMTCFFSRLSLERPALRDEINTARRKQGRQELVVNQADERDRQEFLGKELPAVLAAIAAGEGGPLHDTPPAL